MIRKYVLFSAMMFVQYLMLPVWFVPLLPYVQSLDGGASWVLWCGLIMGFGTFTSPLVGMFADRFLNAERVLALCNFVGAAILSAALALLAGIVVLRAPVRQSQEGVNRLLEALEGGTESCAFGLAPLPERLYERLCAHLQCPLFALAVVLLAIASVIS